MTLSPLTLFSAQNYAGLTYPSIAAMFGELSRGEASRFVGVSADVDGQPAGLALASVSGPDTALVMSIVVKTEYRRQGIAGRMLDELMAVLERRGCRRFETTLERGRASRDVIERMLAARGFTTPVPRALMGRVCDGGVLLRQARWWNRPLMPASFTMFPWSELTDVDRRTIVDRQARAPWYPANLDPFIDEARVEPLNSLGLRDRSGAVVGWVVTHRPLPDLVRYSSLFVREDLQRFGIAVPLLLESMRLHVFSDAAREFPNATFKIPLSFDSMARFARTRMAPYLNELNEIVDTVRIVA